MGDMTAAHFIFIPSVLLIGMVIGWVFGSRAAARRFRLGAGSGREREQRREPKLKRPDRCSARPEGRAYGPGAILAAGQNYR